MNSSKKCNKLIASFFLIPLLTLSNLQLSTCSSIESDNFFRAQMFTSTKLYEGVRPLSGEDISWMKENMVETHKVVPNNIGLKRAYEERYKKSRQKWNSNMSQVGAKEISSIMGDYESDSQSIDEVDFDKELKSYVDNSTELPYFPPIMDQRELQSCVAFSTTYYMATHMTALARGWDVRDKSEKWNKFSPKWTYNFINNATNYGTNHIDAFKVFMDQGIATLKDWDYDDNYSEWPSNVDVWQNALEFRPEKMGFVKIFDGSPTPVKYEKDPALNKIKQLLSNGYVLSFSSFIGDWKYKPIEDNYLSTVEDELVGRAACYMVESGDSVIGHAMTLVGYCDDIWVDINQNDIIDSGEKGAFKIANSYGEDWGIDPESGQTVYDGDGFIWMCYDALNSETSVEEFNSSRQSGWLDGNIAYWMIAKESYTPSIIAQLKISHPKRNQLQYQIGISEFDEESPLITWSPTILNKTKVQGECPFNTGSGEGTVVLDYTPLLRNIVNGKPYKYYIKVSDISEDGICGEIIDFKLFDMQNKVIKELPNPWVHKIDGNSATFCIEYATIIKDLMDTPWSIKKDIPNGTLYSWIKIFSYNNNLYLYGQNNSSGSYELVQYNSLQDTWSVYDKFPEIDPKSLMVESKGKIVVIQSKIDTMSTCKERKVLVYDILARKWEEKVRTPMPDNRAFSSVVEGAGKLYVVGGVIYDNENLTSSITNSCWEYDMENDVWNPLECNMKYSRRDLYSIVIGENIYVFGGRRENTITVASVEVYNMNNKTWSEISFIPHDLSYVYDFNGVGFDNKIFLFGYGSVEGNSIENCTYEFDPYSLKWNLHKSMPVRDQFIMFEVCDSKIYGVQNSLVMEFDPHVDGDDNKDVEDIKEGKTLVKDDVSTDYSISNTYIRNYILGINQDQIVSESSIKQSPNINNEAGETIGDLNGDGSIDSTDLTILKRFNMGLITYLPNNR